MPAPAKVQKRQVLNMRVSAREQNLIDRAAHLKGASRTEFVLAAACQAAEEVVLDHALIELDPQAYADFVARLDAPPQPNKRLVRTLRTAPPWKEP